MVDICKLQGAICLAFCARPLILGVPPSWGFTLDIDTDERFLWNKPVTFFTFAYIFDTIIVKCVHMSNVFFVCCGFCVLSCLQQQQFLGNLIWIHIVEVTHTYMGFG
jgi:hypothetical protein